MTALMPQLEEELARLVAIPSSSRHFEPRQPLLDAYDFVVGCCATRVEVLEPLELPDTAPVIRARSSLPTELRRSRLRPLRRRPRRRRVEVGIAAVRGDRARRRDLRRGAADSKSNILVHVGALRAWGGKLLVGIKLVIEGQEEIGSALTTFPPSQPELFAADARW